MFTVKGLVHRGYLRQFAGGKFTQGFFSVTLLCVFVMYPRCFVFQNPGAETAKLILNTLLYGVFHFLTPFRNRKGGVISSLSQE